MKKLKRAIREGLKDVQLIWTSRPPHPAHPEHFEEGVKAVMRHVRPIMEKTEAWTDEKQSLWRMNP